MRKVRAAKALGTKAQAILVFRKGTKVGLGIGAQHGEGALIKGGKTAQIHCWKRRMRLRIDIRTT
jgi:lipid-binding SYLF domain-containing protein